MHILVAQRGIDGLDTYWDYHGSGYFTGKGQKSVIRDQKSEIRSQRSEVRDQKSEIRSQRSEVRSQFRPFFSEGVNGIDIGADAGDTKLPDDFASVLSLQCAYECFMGDADIRFVEEASRILDKKGRYGIAPLYLEDEYFVSTSPFCDQFYVKIKPSARRVWRDDEYRVLFSRHYSPEVFSSRVYSRIPDGMEVKILYFKNLDEVMKRYPGQRVYCFFMFIGQKIKKI